jgi:predicted transporter
MKREEIEKDIDKLSLDTTNFLLFIAIMCLLFGFIVGLAIGFKGSANQTELIIRFKGAQYVEQKDTGEVDVR